MHGNGPVDDDYLHRVDCDMARTGLHPLGWTTTQPCPLRAGRQLPTPEQLAAPDFALAATVQTWAQRTATPAAAV